MYFCSDTKENQFINLLSFNTNLNDFILKLIDVKYFNNDDLISNTYFGPLNILMACLIYKNIELFKILYKRDDINKNFINNKNASIITIFVEKLYNNILVNNYYYNYYSFNQNIINMLFNLFINDNINFKYNYIHKFKKENKSLLIIMCELKIKKYALILLKQKYINFKYIDKNNKNAFAYAIESNLISICKKILDLYNLTEIYEIDNNFKYNSIYICIKIFNKRNLELYLQNKY